jgi:hypothetical protein
MDNKRFQQMEKRLNEQTEATRAMKETLNKFIAIIGDQEVARNVALSPLVSPPHVTTTLQALQPSRVKPGIPSYFVGDREVDDFTIEEDDHIFMVMVHLVNPHHFVHASSTVSGHLAKVFAKNSKLRVFEDIVLMSLHTYADVFSETAFDSLPECRKWDHTIELECKPSPGFCKVYPMILTEQMEIDAFPEEALATGCIRQSKSLLEAPVFFIKKKDGKLCFVQDYRVLNAITRKNLYPLPLINDLIHWLKGVRYFTKLDIHWGHNNVRICEGDEWKAAFHTNRGLFEPLVMYFSLTNSPATFQTMMNEIF